jgi:hypothetical protein
MREVDIEEINLKAKNVLAREFPKPTSSSDKNSSLKI